MVTNNLHLHFKQLFCVIMAFFALLVVSCHKPEDDEMSTDVPTAQEAGAQGVYVLNEGLFQMNNSTISYYDFTQNQLTEDFFLNVNHRGLGDTGSDLKKYGGKLYCVVNLSEVVEIMNSANCQSIKRILLSGKQPRHIAFDENKAYISCFNGEIIQIDTATLEITASSHAGSNPDGICVANSKLYVANSGGLNYPNYGNTVSVFSLPNLIFVKNIQVALNPMRLQSDEEGDVYLVSNGNYEDVPFTFQRIDSQLDEVVQTFSFPVTNFCINGSQAYLYSYNYNTQQSSFKVMNVHSETIIQENFITDGTQIETPYGIAVNPSNGDVYIADAHQYTVNGDVFCFGNDGKKKFSIEAGICPSAVVFKNN